MTLQRRQFLTMLGASALTGCGDSVPEHRYNQSDIDLLTRQKTTEAAQKAEGTYRKHAYHGYRGLAKLPWFELNSDDELVCVDETITGTIDMHAHLGMSVLFKADLDLQATHPRVKHLLNCDDPKKLCELHLDEYANGNFSQEALGVLQTEIRNQGLWGSEFASTQTIPSLLHEMNLMRVEQATLLPIKLGLWFGDDLTEQWRSQVDIAEQAHRLLTGFSIHPLKSGWREEMLQHAAQGLKLMKLHPTVQRFYPDDERVLEVYELAAELGVTIFFHGGRAGIEPASSRPFAMPRHYETALANFPSVKFILGHAGARDFDAMLELAVRYENTWIGIHGQSLSNLDKMIAITQGQRLLFGTDWPFYHIGMSLAKVLITTDSPTRKAIRTNILKANAQQLLMD